MPQSKDRSKGRTPGRPAGRPSAQGTGPARRATPSERAARGDAGSSARGAGRPSRDADGAPSRRTLSLKPGDRAESAAPRAARPAGSRARVNTDGEFSTTKPVRKAAAPRSAPAKFAGDKFAGGAQAGKSTRSAKSPSRRPAARAAEGSERPYSSDVSLERAERPKTRSGGGSAWAGADKPRSGPRPGPKARVRKEDGLRGAPERSPAARPATAGAAARKPRKAAGDASHFPPPPEPSADGRERIQKWLASAGVASRRAIEDWINEGRISVNGQPAEIGQRVGPKDRISVDGRLLRIAPQSEKLRVLLYKKRVGEVVTRADPEGRRTVFRKLPELEHGRWIAVGRLDINTSGLLLLTNDGELAKRLMHPSYELARSYAVRVLGNIEEEVINRLKRGVELDDGPAKFNTIDRVDGREFDDEEGGSANRWFKVTVREGRNRLVRRLFESQELQVSRLIRVGYGPVELGSGIKSGSYRELAKDEVSAVLQAVGMKGR